MNDSTVTKTLVSGTLIHLNGIPLELANDTDVLTTESNFRLAMEAEQPDDDGPSDVWLAAGTPAEKIAALDAMAGNADVMRGVAPTDSTGQ